MRFDKWLKNRTLNENLYLNQSAPETDSLLASVLKKLDSQPGHMPYDSLWTGMDAIIRRFGLTKDEALALARCKGAYQHQQDGDMSGYKINRLLLKMNAATPPPPKKFYGGKL